MGLRLGKCGCTCYCGCCPAWLACQTSEDQTIITYENVTWQTLTVTGGVPSYTTFATAASVGPLSNVAVLTDVDGCVSGFNFENTDSSHLGIDYYTINAACDAARITLGWGSRVAYCANNQCGADGYELARLCCMVVALLVTNWDAQCIAHKMKLVTYNVFGGATGGPDPSDVPFTNTFYPITDAPEQHLIRWYWQDDVNAGVIPPTESICQPDYAQVKWKRLIFETWYQPNAACGLDYSYYGFRIFFDLVVTCGTPPGFARTAAAPPEAAAKPARCRHLSEKPIRRSEAAARKLSPLRTWRECAKGHGPQCLCLSRNTCGPSCTDYSTGSEGDEDDDEGAPLTTFMPTIYITPAELSTLVRRYRRTKSVSDDLGSKLMLIAAGIHRRFRYIREKDEFVSLAVMYILEAKVLDHADPKKNLFNYFTTVIRHFGVNLRDAQIKALEAELNYRDVVAMIAARLERRRESLTPDQDEIEAHALTIEVFPSGQREPARNRDAVQSIDGFARRRRTHSNSNWETVTR